MGSLGDERAGELVSCLMVTRLSPERRQLTRAAFAGFQAQTHPRRELVVVVDASADVEGRRDLERMIRGAAAASIRVVEAPGAPPLGALRNLAVAAAAGDHVCQWDDDDIYHPERLSAQLTTLLSGGHEAVGLQDVLQFYPASRTLYWTNWRATQAGLHPGTVLMRRGAPVRYPETGPQAALGEDTVLALALRARGGLGSLAGAPHLFAYVSHGKNSWDDGHHRMLAETLAISRGLLQRQEAALRAGVAALDFELAGGGAGPISVRGANGPAFEIAAAVSSGRPGS